MKTVPASAPGFVGLAIGAVTLQLALVGVRFGFHASALHVLVAFGFVPCVLALLWPGPGGFRAATVVAECVLGTAAVILGMLLFSVGEGPGRPGGTLAGLTMPVVTVAPLVAAYRRAGGVECGRRLAVVGWSAAALSGVGWLLLIFG
ncbi:hypothetical protein [Kitasatospora sp. NPDC005856]|uniref:hypothetical protein n=1 Tax=Kitasatospora sp. NPDC005856 TaxID=3154566 RepID=UPI0033E767C9